MELRSDDALVEELLVLERLATERHTSQEPFFEQGGVRGILGFECFERGVRHLLAFLKQITKRRHRPGVEQGCERLVDVWRQLLENDAADEQPLEPFGESIHERTGDAETPLEEQRGAKGPRESDELLACPKVRVGTPRSRSIEEMAGVRDERFHRSAGDRPPAEVLQHDRALPLRERDQPELQMFGRVRGGSRLGGQGLALHPIR